MQYHNYIVHCNICYDIQPIASLANTSCNSKIYFVFSKKGVDICPLLVYNKVMKKGRETQKTRRGNKMNETEKKQELVDYINSMNADEMIELHNNYCDATDDADARIYSMWDLDDVLSYAKPTDILCMGFHGDFNPHHEYFWFNGYGNLESADYIAAMPIYAEDIADYILRKEDSLGNDEIQYMLDRETNF